VVPLLGLKKRIQKVLVLPATSHDCELRLGRWLINIVGALLWRSRSLLMTTNVPCVESVLVIAVLTFVGILALVLLGFAVASCKE